MCLYFILLIGLYFLWNDRIYFLLFQYVLYYLSIYDLSVHLYHPYVIHHYFGTIINLILSDCRFLSLHKFAGKYVVREGEESPLSIGARDTTEVNISVRQTPAKSLSFGN